MNRKGKNDQKTKNRKRKIAEKNGKEWERTEKNEKERKRADKNIQTR